LSLSLHFTDMHITKLVRSIGIQCMWKVSASKTLKSVNVHSISPII
jgi:hypothetical protein